jgi:hypothetical protein
MILQIETDFSTCNQQPCRYGAADSSVTVRVDYTVEVNPYCSVWWKVLHVESAVIL